MIGIMDITKHGIQVQNVIRNATTARLYEYAIEDRDAVIASSGALATRSGDKTGRSPKDKRIVEPTRGCATILFLFVSLNLVIFLNQILFAKTN